MKRAITTSLALLLLGLLLPACATEDFDARLLADLAGRDFVATEVRDDGGVLPLVPGTQLRLHIDEGGVWTRASAGCNELDGEFTLRSARFYLESGVQTGLSCPGMADQEAWYFSFLSDWPAVALDGDELTMRAGSDLIVFELAPSAGSPAS